MSFLKVLAGLVVACFWVGQVHASTEMYFIHNDHLGTPQVVTDQSQNVVWQGQKKPFGETEETTNTIEQLSRFPGQYFDEESGLHYNYFRDYDPTVGRYVQSDPIGLRGGINTYAYVGGNPLINTDVLGLAYSPEGEHGRSREDVMQLPQGDDPCGCFAKAFLGYEEVTVVAVGAVTGPYINKPRAGVSGGGPAGKKTSALSSLVHQVNKRVGKSAASAAVRTTGRVASRLVPGAGTALLTYDLLVLGECLEECEEDECK